MKKILSLLLTAFLLYTFIPAPALAVTSGDYEYTVNLDGISCTITDYTGSGGVITIPDTLDGYAVTEIGNNAFKGKGLAYATIPDGVTSIGNEAFRFNSIAGVSIPDSVQTIGEYAYSENLIEILYLGVNLETINRYAFYENLITELTMYDNVKTIGQGAFYSNRIHTLTFGEGVETIGRSAFNWNLLTYVSIPDKVTEIGPYAFDNNDMNLFNLPRYTGYAIWEDDSGNVYFDGDTVSVINGYSITNYLPKRINEVQAATAANAQVNSRYVLDLSTVFEDLDEGDTLTYEVNIDGRGYVSADEMYSYIAASTGLVSLTFRAYDGTHYSEETYTVTLLVTNERPARQSAVPAETDFICLNGNDYSASLSQIFEDINGDSLIFEVNIDGAGYISAAKKYLYTPASPSTQLVFRAYDGYEYSTDTYAVNVYMGYSVTYHLDGSINHQDNPDVFAQKDLNIVLEDAVKDGYSFDGWYTESGYVNKVKAITATGDVELWAKFRIEYDFNDDSQVDMLDLVMVAQCYGGNVDYFDAANDGIINLFDLVAVAGVIE